MDRLRDDGAAEFERFLLDSALEEAPAPELRARVLTTVGAAALAGTAAAGLHSALPGATAGETAALAGGKAALTAGSAAKALLVKGVVMLATTGVATGVVVVARQETPPPAPRAAAPASVVKETPRTELLPLVAGQEARSSGRETAESARSAPVRETRKAPLPSPDPVTASRLPATEAARPPVTAPRLPAAAETPHPTPSSIAAPVSTGALPPLEPAHPAAPPRASHSVASEVAALDRARAALSAGNASGALYELSRYDAEFPSGALRQEKTVLEVRALLAAGERQRARARVDEFLARDPGSAQRARLRALVE